MGATEHKVAQAVVLFFFGLLGAVAPVVLVQLNKNKLVSTRKLKATIVGRTTTDHGHNDASKGNPKHLHLHSGLHLDSQKNYGSTSEMQPSLGQVPLDKLMNSSPSLLNIQPNVLEDGGNSSEVVAVVLSCGNAFAGGIMLATGLVHILGDALELSISIDTESSVKVALFAPLVYCIVGILIPFTLEKSGLALWLLQHQQWCTNHYVDVHQGNHDHTSAVDWLANTSFDSPCSINPRYEDTSEQQHLGNNWHSASMDDSQQLSALVNGHIPGKQGNLGGNHHLHCSSKCVVPSLNSTRIQSRLDMYRSTGSTRSLAYAPLIYANELSTGMLSVKERQRSGSVTSMATGDPSNMSNIRIKRTSSMNARIRTDVGQHEGGMNQVVQQHQQKKCVSDGELQGSVEEDNHNHPRAHSHLSFSTFLMFLVLSVHSAIVGMTIGTIEPSVGSSQNPAFFAVALHKVFESMVLGTSAANNHDKLSFTVVLELTIYIVAAPLGILAGTFISYGEPMELTSQTAMLGIASGSFIYIALIEILGEEFENEEYRIAKFVCFAFGTLIMTLLAD